MTSIRHLVTLSKNPCEPEVEWYENALKSWICPDCRTVRADSPLLDVVLNARPDNASVNFVSAAGLGVISRAFMEQVGESTFREYFELGTLIGPNGKVVDDHFSFRGKQLVFIRGDTKSSYRRCADCGRFLYHPSGKRYVLSHDVTDDHWYESQFHQLLIPEVKNQAIKAALSKTAQYEIPVQSRPDDDLELLLV